MQVERSTKCSSRCPCACAAGPLVGQRVGRCSCVPAHRACPRGIKSHVLCFVNAVRCGIGTHVKGMFSSLWWQHTQSAIVCTPCGHTQTGRGRRPQATVLLVVTAFMIWLKARKMQHHPRLMDPELAAIMRNGKGRVFKTLGGLAVGVPCILQCGAPPAEGRASALLCHGLDMRRAAAVRRMCCIGLRAHGVRCIGMGALPYGSRSCPILSSRAWVADQSTGLARVAFTGAEGCQ